MLKRILPLLLLVAALAAAPAAAARSAPLIFGVSDNYGKYADDSGDWFFSTVREGNMTENAMVVLWHPGQVAPAADETAFLDRSIAKAQQKGVRIVMVVYPANPREHDAEQFCQFIRGLAVRYEWVDEWAVGNEVNKADFWFPPTPESYIPVLARCYDLLKALDETVIGFELSPRRTASSPSPVQYLKGAGAFIPQGRTAPIMDVFGYHPHPNQRNLRGVKFGPDDEVAWPDTGPANIDRVKQAIHDAFHGTVQPDVDQGLQLKLRELGWQVDTEGRPLYVGTENVPVVDDATQAAYYVRMIDKLVCDPHVKEVLFFLLVDERERGGRNAAGRLVSGGWQSGSVRADLSKREAFSAIAAAIARTGGMCPGAEHVWRPATGVVGARANFADANRVHPRKGTYFAFNVGADEQATYLAKLVRVGGRVVFTKSGLVKAGHDPLARFPKRRLAPGRYFYTVVLTAWANESRTTTFTSKVFLVR